MPRGVPIALYRAIFEDVPQFDASSSYRLWLERNIMRSRKFFLLVGCMSAALVSLEAAAGQLPGEKPFLRETDAAMARMMNGMSVNPTGNIDTDFAAMMIPHHQGAIDMAIAELRHGRNEKLRRIAQEIIVDQQQEIAAMRLALGDALPASVAAPTRPVAGAPATSRHPTPSNAQHQP